LPLAKKNISVVSAESAEIRGSDNKKQERAHITASPSIYDLPLKQQKKYLNYLPKM
jgi:hypothetical protein